MGYGFNEDALVKSVCEESFYCFVQEFWGTIIARKPVWNWHIKYLCDELQLLAEDVFRNKPRDHDLLINISPGSTKSTVCSVMFPAWVWTRMPQAQFITASYSKDLAMDLSRRSRDVITSQKYQKLWPHIQMRSDQNVKTHFQNLQGGFRVAVGTGGITGFHGHFIIVDDPLDPNKALSDAELKAANSWLSETLSQRKVDKALTPTVLIMQRLHQGDPSYQMQLDAEPGRLRHICLPAYLTPNVKPPELRRYYQDELMDPVRLSRPVLIENRAKLHEYGFAGQFLQDPVPPGGGMFKTDRIQFGCPPNIKDKQKWVKFVRAWDKAGTTKGGCYTVGLLMAKDIDQRFWILDIVRDQWDSFERERQIKLTANMDGRGVVVGLEQEPGSGGKESAQKTTVNLAGFRVRTERPTGEKQDRADAFSSQVNGGNVWIPAGAPWALKYLEELKFFPYSIDKDQVDASSLAFTILTPMKKKIGGLWKPTSSSKR